jgi:hypothetical protein
MFMNGTGIGVNVDQKLAEQSTSNNREARRQAIQHKADEIRERSKKWWSERSNLERVGIIVLNLARVGLTLVALADLRRRPADKLNGNKMIWGTVVVSINFIGPIAYFIFGRKRE